MSNKSWVQTGKEKINKAKETLKGWSMLRHFVVKLLIQRKKESSTTG